MDATTPATGSSTADAAAWAAMRLSDAWETGVELDMTSGASPEVVFFMADGVGVPSDLGAYGFEASFRRGVVRSRPT